MEIFSRLLKGLPSYPYSKDRPLWKIICIQTYDSFIRHKTVRLTKMTVHFVRPTELARRSVHTRVGSKDRLLLNWPSSFMIIPEQTYLWLLYDFLENSWIFSSVWIARNANLEMMKKLKIFENGLTGLSRVMIFFLV